MFATPAPMPGIPAAFFLFAMDDSDRTYGWDSSRGLDSAVEMVGALCFVLEIR